MQLSEDGARVRACQGHSIEVDLQCERAEPPAVLYHGTGCATVSEILSDDPRTSFPHDATQTMAGGQVQLVEAVVCNSVAMQALFLLAAFVAGLLFERYSAGFLWG